MNRASSETQMENKNMPTISETPILLFIKYAVGYVFRIDPTNPTWCLVQMGIFSQSRFRSDRADLYIRYFFIPMDEGAQAKQRRRELGNSLR